MRRRADYLRIQSTAQRVTTRHYHLLVAPSGLAPGSPSRFGLIVTRKVGSAVVRNRIKRVARECFRRTPGFVPDGIDLIVVARPGAAELSFAEAAAEWASVRELVRKRARQALARSLEKDHVGGRRDAPR